MHHNNFSAADIEKYRKGQLSPAQMHALEKAAMDDPFLADAMEGFGVGKPEPGVGSQEDNIKELHERLRQRVEEKKSRTIPIGSWWKIAASVIVVGGGVWLFSVNNSPLRKSDIAAKEAVRPPESASAATDSVPSAPAETTTHSSISANALPQGYRQDSASATVQPAKQAATSPARPAPEVVASKEAEIVQSTHEPLAKKLNSRVPGLYIKQDTVSQSWAKSKADAYNNDTGHDKDGNEELLSRRRPATASNNMPFKDSVREYKVTARGYMNSPLNTFNGQVLDKLNKPVPGASIVIPGRQQTYLTDSLGNFAFTLADTAVKVSVASVGYTQRYFTLRNSNNFGAGNGLVNNNASYNKSIAANNAAAFSNRIVLQQSNPALNEVVVVGYGARKKEVLNNRLDADNDTKPNPLEAEPVTGWDEFNDYLDRSKKIPDGADDIHGNVVVRFNVDSDGTLKNFAIEKSLSDALDAEAIRLVKEGPSWHLLKKKNKKTKVTVMVRF